MRVPAPGPDPDEREPTPEEVEALREVHARLVATPVEDVVANHALGIWQLALVHLGVITPPDADGRPPGPNLVGRRARDRRDGRARRRARRAARRARGRCCATRSPRPRCCSSRSPTTARTLAREAGVLEPVVLDGPLRSARAASRSRTCPALAAAAAEDRSHVRLDAGPRRRGRVPRERRAARSRNARPGGGSRSRRSARPDRRRPRRRVDLVPRSATLARRRRPARQHRDRRDVARGVGAAHAP